MPSVEPQAARQERMPIVTAFLHRGGPHRKPAWWWLSMALALSLLALSGPAGAAAPTGFNKCSSCHSNPPLLPNGSNMVPVGAATADTAALRTKMRDKEQPAGTFPMKVLADSAALTDDILGNIRLYLIDVRDGAVSPAAGPFGDGIVGAGTPTQIDFTITNERREEASFASGPASDSADFPVVGGTCLTPGLKLKPFLNAALEQDPAASCTVSVRFTPASTGDKTGFLAFTLNTRTGVVPAARSLPLSGRGLLPIEVTTTSLVFTASTTKAPLSDTRSVAVTNNIGASIRACVKADTDSPQYSHPEDYKISSPPAGGDGCSVLDPPGTGFDITFKPKASGRRNARLEVQRLDAGVPTGTVFPVHLLGGQEHVAVANADSLFDGLEVEVTNHASVSRSVAISSWGNGNLAFNGFSITPAGQTDYTLAGTGCQALAELPKYTGDPAPTCEVTVRFDPTEAGPRAATLMLDTNAGPVALPLKGTGMFAPRLVVKEGIDVLASGATVAFGEQTFGGFYPPRTIVLHNIGTADDLALSLPASWPAGVVAVPGAGCSGVLPAGSDCRLDLSFVPASASTVLDVTPVIRSRAAGAATWIDFALHLSGRGVAYEKPALVWRDLAEQALGELQFGETAAGRQTLKTVRLRNSGPGGIELMAVNAIGPGASHFTVALGTCTPAALVLPAKLYEGGSCDLVIGFAPSGAGAKAATLQVISSGSVTAGLVVRGTGVAPVGTSLTLSPDTMAFAEVEAGARSAPQSVTLAVAGSAPLNVTAIEVSGPFAVQATSCPTTPFVLAAGSACQVEVVYAPTAEGSDTGSLSVAVDGLSPTEAALSGEAAPEADVSSGGCSIASGRSPADPTLWLLLLGAVAVLMYRWRDAKRRGRGSP